MRKIHEKERDLYPYHRLQHGLRNGEDHLRFREHLPRQRADFQGDREGPERELVVYLQRGEGWAGEGLFPGIYTVHEQRIFEDTLEPDFLRLVGAICSFNQRYIVLLTK